MVETLIITRNQVLLTKHRQFPCQTVLTCGMTQTSLSGTIGSVASAIPRRLVFVAVRRIAQGPMRPFGMPFAGMPGRWLSVTDASRNPL